MFGPQYLIEMTQPSVPSAPEDMIGFFWSLWLPVHTHTHKCMHTHTHAHTQTHEHTEAHIYIIQNKHKFLKII